MATRTLTREEAKSITRRRLLEASATVLAETGYGGLSASAVARAAGVAQPTFYVHFRDKDDLLRTLGEEQMGLLRTRLRAARQAVLAGQGVEAVKETFRVPLRTWVEHPVLLRLYLQELHQPASPLGELARVLRADIRRDLVDDLVQLGLPASTPAERERVEMIAEGMIAQTEALATAYVDGRWTDFDAVVDVLTQYAVGVLPLAHDAATAKS
ncbi:MAG: TetR family transcriptional regulator [bacterium]|nr:TetR family transcriptional regulator [bacterium]